MPDLPSPGGLAGLFVPIVTPFTADGDVDVMSLRKLAHQLLADGADGLVALGTTGEPATLSADERRIVVDVCDAACRAMDRLLIVGAGTNSTTGTIDEISRLTDGLTAAAALVVVPYYTRPSQQAVVEHFGLVADRSPVPLVIYNIPHRTGRGLNAASLLQAGAHPNIAALKQSVGALDIDTLEILGAQADSDFRVLAGDDAFIAPTMLMGGAGAIAAAAHTCTRLFAEMVGAAHTGTVNRAAELAHRLQSVVTAGFAEPSPAVWKGALASAGVIASDHVRRPLTSASPPAIARLVAACESAF